jgi:hypothetical protein
LSPAWQEKGQSQKERDPRIWLKEYTKCENRMGGRGSIFVQGRK